MRKIFSTIILSASFIIGPQAYSFESAEASPYIENETMDGSVQDVISSDAVLSICDRMSFKRENIDLNCFNQTDRKAFQRCRERQQSSYRLVETEEKNFMCVDNQTTSSIKILNKYISEKQCYKSRVDAVMDVVKSDDYQNLSREFVDVFKGRFKLHFSYQPGDNVGNLNIDLSDLEEGLVKEEEKNIPLMMTSFNKGSCRSIDQSTVINMIREKIEDLSAKLNLRLAQRAFSFGESSHIPKHIDDSARGNPEVESGFDVQDYQIQEPAAAGAAVPK